MAAPITIPTGPALAHPAKIAIETPIVTNAETTAKVPLTI